MMSAQDKLVKQILGQGLTGKWSGQGHGSAEANAQDMARILDSIGITDIKQLGKLPTYESVTTAPIVPGKFLHRDSETGGYYINTPDGREGIDPSQYKSHYGKWVPGDYGMEFTPADQSKVIFKDDQPFAESGYTFGNKETGQVVPNTYSERQHGDFFGGTFAGKGNTGYGVKFQPDGTPIFYTSGASSNDLANLLSDPLLGTVAQIGAATFGGPMGTAALNAAMGKSPEDILKAAAMSYMGNQAGSAVSSMGGITDILGETGTKVASNVAKQFVGSGGKNVDPVKALLSSGFMGGPSGGPNSADFEKGYFHPGGAGYSASYSGGENVFDPTFGGTMPIYDGESVFDPTYGGTMPIYDGNDKTSTGGVGKIGSSARSLTPVKAPTKTPTKTSGVTNVAGANSVVGNAIAGAAGAGTAGANATNALPETAQPQTSSADLINFLSGENKLANIKSFKELFGGDLFGGSYAPPSANRAQPSTEYQAGSSAAPQSEGEEQFAEGGSVDDLAKQILGQNTSSKWSGAGHGSAEANARDMAKILADIGITDIKQFGKIPIKVPVYLSEEVGRVGTEINFDEEGKPYFEYMTGAYDEYGSPFKNREYDVDPSKIVKAERQTDVTWGNTKTGQVVPHTYSDGQYDNTWGGTYAGKGNTAYKVHVQPDGTPLFYTQGKSSNDLAKTFSEFPLLGTIAQIGASYFGGPIGSAALNAAMGKSPEDILKAAAMSYIGNEAGSAVSGIEGITDVLGEVGTKVASNVAKQFVGSGGQNVDPVKALLASGVVNGFMGGESGGPNSADFEKGYFHPGGAGYSASYSGGENVFDPTFGGTMPIYDGESVFDPTYGGTMPIYDGNDKTSTGGVGKIGSSARSLTPVKAPTKTPTKTSGVTNVAGANSVVGNAIAGAAGAGTAGANATNALPETAQPQTSSADLINFLSGENKLANIKSFKELFGGDLFGGSYAPPSANRAQPSTEYQAGSSAAPQSEGEEQFAEGGSVDDLAKQILGQNTSSKWSGAGHGSAEANARDMAKILADIGITDIKQFGKIPIKVPVYLSEEVGRVGTEINFDEEGKPYFEYMTGAYDEYGSPFKNREYDVDPSKIVKAERQTDVTWGNTKTGQVVPHTYSDGQYDNTWGGTYAGKGNTAYKVHVQPDGTPLFYTQGKSSNDLAKTFSEFPLLGTIAQIGASYFGGPIGSAALNAAMGKSPEDILKAAAMSYIGNEAGSAVSGIEGITDVLGEVGTKVASNVAKQFVGSGGQNVDPVKALLASGVVNGFMGGESGGPNSADFEGGFFRPGGGGYMDPSGGESVFDPTFGGVLPMPTDFTGPGYYDEINDKFIPDPLGGMQGPLGPETGNFDPNQKWEYSLTRPGVWSNDAGEEIDLSYMPDRNTAMTGKELMDKAGVSSDSFKSNVKPPTEAKPATPGAKPATPGAKPATPGSKAAGAVGSALAGAAGALGAGSAETALPGMAQQQTSNADLLNLLGSKPELANIKSYKELFGEDLFGGKYVPPSAGGDQSDGVANYGRRDDSGTASQSEDEEQLFRGGHVDDFDADALLQILRS